MDKTKKFIIYLLPVFIWLFYSGIFFTGKIDDRSNELNYFKFLSQSILNGRFDVDCPHGTGCADLVEYNGKYYLYWPWVPAIVYLPIVAAVGTNIPDVLISSIFGVINIFLLIIFLRLFSEKFDLKIKESDVILLCLFWGLGTVHFYMSMVGSVWFIAQIMAQTFLLLSAVFILKYQTVAGFFLSGFFYALAVYTKNDVLFFVFFLCAIWYVLCYKKGNKNLQQIMSFFLPFVIISILNLGYNYVRFGNMFENGIKYHRMHEYFRPNYVRYGYFSIFYFPHNFITEVLLPPPFKTTFPFFKYEIEGFGFLWNSPLFLLIIPFVYFIFTKNKKKRIALKKDDVILLTGAFLSLLFISSVIFLIMGNGWAQFASRYSLDYQLMLFVFLLYSFAYLRQYKWFFPVVTLLLLISFYMNVNGVLYFLGPELKI
ncbi:MAG: hypothetical protein KA120_08355 [Candidatus Goldbacteria bacterium]|nr:hypothetical protein [Candidatus Goldiibacteriota bacterium]